MVDLLVSWVKGGGFGGAGRSGSGEGWSLRKKIAGGRRTVGDEGEDFGNKSLLDGRILGEEGVRYRGVIWGGIRNSYEQAGYRIWSSGVGLSC